MEITGEARKVGGGLVEISAVSTIIGAPIAEALTHGLKAACGMVWGPMSCFGVIHVAKACLSASVPDLIRESMGLRNQFVDNAIGVMLDVDRFKQARSRMDLGDALAIEVTPRRKWVGQQLLQAWTTVAAASSRTRREVRRKAKRRYDPEKARVSDTFDIAEMKAQESHKAVYESRSVYTLDWNSRLVLDTVPAAEKGSPIDIYRFQPDLGGAPAAWKDWLWILLSMAKLVEVFVLWKLGSRSLWAWTMAGWAHAFLSAILLQVAGLGRDHPDKATRNIIAGTLPSPLRLGEKGKIVLGLPANVRRHVLWRTALAVGTLVNVAGLFGIFLFLDGEPVPVVYSWIGFQILWLAMRTIIYFVVPGGVAGQAVMACQRWNEALPHDRQQVMTLMNELSAHQASTHPRGFHAYLFDCMSFHQLSVLLGQVDWKLTPSLPCPALSESEPPNTIEITDATGDPVIRTTVWQQGESLDNSELYDSCIAFVRGFPDSDKNNTSIAIPCVRVHSCHCGNRDGPNRGNSHRDCGNIEWWYFLPIEADLCPLGRKWVLAHGKLATGRLSAELITDEELDRRLSEEWWKISIAGLTDMKAALEVSSQAAKVTVHFTKGIAAASE
ncbi:hypothetical protein VTN00DRAFT_2542 [Thermoascus crustaceus]|uniref:uncharacterized protein n=1 Tax=Thermoascus crustaceus TaxID=5088 RepID=UPI00374218A9